MPNILLITLGNSPMIVPEVTLGYGVRFNEVHIFTTDNPRLQEHTSILKTIFENEFADVLFTITALKGIEIPNTTELHQLFEEALFQWYLGKSRTQLPYAC